MTKAVNPILKGFYPDPSVCRVGGDFYLANSSFGYFPGVPLFHSRDLAHWEQLGNILDREEQLLADPGETEISRGIFAPTIRYHDGVFYMITTNVSHGQNFFVTAKDPKGPWSRPHYLGEAAPGIDPSLFFDEDGKCYYVGTRPNPQGPRYNGDWEIWVQELDLRQGQLTGESRAVWKGAMRNAIWPEGPHLYKIGGYYYLLHAEGGTSTEHSICAARSREVFGPYEGCPCNPVFTHRHMGKNCPVTCVGHCDLVDDEKGNWYAVMLASRPCQGYTSLGRETFLARVKWEDGWPVFNPGIGRLEDTVELPLEEARVSQEISDVDSFHFWDSRLDDRLLGIWNRDASCFSLTAREGFLRIFAKEERIAEPGRPAYLCVRQKSSRFRAECGMFFEPEKETETAGLVLFQNHANHLRAEIVKAENEKALRVTAHIHGKDETLGEAPLEGKSLIGLCLAAQGQRAVISVKTAGCWKEAACADLKPYTTEESGGFVGCTLGMYVSGNGEKSENYADFAWFSVANGT